MDFPGVRQIRCLLDRLFIRYGRCPESESWSWRRFVRAWRGLVTPAIGLMVAGQIEYRHRPVLEEIEELNAVADIAGQDEDIGFGAGPMKAPVPQMAPTSSKCKSEAS